MIKIQHLKNAPIVEAVIDIRTNLVQNITKSDISIIKKEFNNDFKDFKEMISFDGRLNFNNNENINTATLEKSNKALLGYRLDSNDDKHIVQFKNNGFTFSRLQPYTNWNEIKLTAVKYWKWYTTFKKIDNISRLAVRFINRISLPFPTDDLSEYLTAAPSLPCGVPHILENFFTKICVRYPKDNVLSNIIHAFEKADEKDGISLILDIDVFSSKTEFVDDDLWNFFDTLRNIKNQIFFGSITQKTLEQFL